MTQSAHTSFGCGPQDHSAPPGVLMADKNTEAVAKAIIKHVVLVHGAPEHLVSDRKPGLASAAMKMIMQRFGSHKSETTGLQPQAMSTLERFHGLKRTDTAGLTASASFYYRVSACETTGHSPFYLLYGRHPTEEAGQGEHQPATTVAALLAGTLDDGCPPRRTTRDARRLRMGISPLRGKLGGGPAGRRRCPSLRGWPAPPKNDRVTD